MVKINDKYYINADANNYVLLLRTTIKDKESKNFGKEQFREVGYYISLESLLEGMLTKELRTYIQSTEMADIKDLLKEVKKQQKFIEKLDIKV